MKFADPQNDIAFRKIFGNETKKIILISFSDSVLTSESDEIEKLSTCKVFE